MANSKQKNIEETLSRFFQEEAADIIPPPSQKLWGDLKERLAREELYPVQASGKPGKGPGTYSWLKNKPLVAMVAASFVLIVFFTKVPPAPSLQQFVLNLFSSSPMEKELQLGESGDAPDSGDAGAAHDASDEASPFAADGRSFEDLQQPQYKIMMTEENSSPMMGVEEKAPETETKTGTGNAMEDNTTQERQFFTARAVKEEMAFEEQPLFTSTLNEIKTFAPEEIWSLKEPPEGFSFHEGSIVKTENFLFQVTQQFVNAEGKVLTLTQDFFQDKKKMESFPLTGNGVADPKQVGPFSGYLFRLEDGFYTLTWKQESSIVTLSGQIEEKLLLSIPNSLKTD
jgi:hypothetical protein